MHKPFSYRFTTDLIQIDLECKITGYSLMVLFELQIYVMCGKACTTT